MLITKNKKIKINFRMSEQEIADFCHVTKRTVRNWRRGVSFPTPAHVEKLKELEASKK